MPPRMPQVQAQAGFTLVELMIVVVITAILAGLAAPSFEAIIESQRAKSAAVDLYIALTRARSEAVKRNTNMTLTPKSGNWASGWQMLDPVSSAVIDDHDAVRTIAIAGPASVTYQGSGRIQGTAAPNFAVTGSQDASARCVAVDLSGRPNIRSGSC